MTRMEEKKEKSTKFIKTNKQAKKHEEREREGEKENNTMKQRTTQHDKEKCLMGNERRLFVLCRVACEQ